LGIAEREEVGTDRRGKGIQAIPNCQEEIHEVLYPEVGGEATACNLS
jgi:hypothetical protein